MKLIPTASFLSDSQQVPVRFRYQIAKTVCLGIHLVGCCMLASCKISFVEILRSFPGQWQPCNPCCCTNQAAEAAAEPLFAERESFSPAPLTLVGVAGSLFQELQHLAGVPGADVIIEVHFVLEEVAHGGNEGGIPA